MAAHSACALGASRLCRPRAVSCVWPFVSILNIRCHMLNRMPIAGSEASCHSSAVGCPRKLAGKLFKTWLGSWRTRARGRDDRPVPVSPHHPVDCSRVPANLNRANNTRLAKLAGKVGQQKIVLHGFCSLLSFISYLYETVHHRFGKPFGNHFETV